jgi:hypothetical protein
MKTGVRPQARKPGSDPDRAELIGAAGWIAFGTAVLVASWRMDRLASLGINPWTAPGLVPGLLGALMLAFGAALALRALWRDSAHGPALRAGEGRRIALALALCTGYAIGLLGKGLPFRLTSSAFLFVAVLVFRILDRDAGARQPLWRLALGSAAIALGASVLIALLFQDVFLVRLP